MNLNETNSIIDSAVGVTLMGQSKGIYSFLEHPK